MINHVDFVCSDKKSRICVSEFLTLYGFGDTTQRTDKTSRIEKCKIHEKMKKEPKKIPKELCHAHGSVGGIRWCHDTSHSLLSLRMGLRYQPISQDRKWVKEVASRPLVKRSPSWLQESIFNLSFDFFGYCPKSPEPEHSSGSGPEFWDP